MGKGLANALLVTSREAFRGATPIAKVTPPGFLQYLLNNSKPNILSQGRDDGSGYIRDVKVRFRTRGVPGKTTSEDNCSVQVKPAYLEYTVPQTMYRALGVAFEDDLIAKFEQDAMATLQLGKPSTSVMKDVYEGLTEQANGIFADINNDLLALQAANFGVNVSTGSNATKNVNFPVNGTNNPLTAGMTDIMADAMNNELRMAGTSIVGSGLILNYYLQHRAGAKGMNDAGLDTSRLALPEFYYDPYAQAAFGANQFGLFEKDAVQFLNVCRFRGPKAGQKGSDFFTTLNIPVIDSVGQGSLGAFEFDVQIIYRTCPGELVIGDGEPIMLQRGYNIILSSSYLSVNVPANSYAEGDRLQGNNGTLRYTATNNA